jgi:hypothetical protein
MENNMDTINKITNTSNIPLYGTIYSGPNKLGDFNWMCKHQLYSNVLFIFNDNEEFHDTCREGSGNAIMRKYNKFNGKLSKPISAGIPTGTLINGGYQKLDEHVISVVTEAINEIKEIVAKYKYDGIFYSVATNGKLGTGLFDVCPEVIDYIDMEIKKLSNQPIQILN